MDNFCCIWDTEKIKSDADIGDNIVEMYVAKIDSLDTETKNALIFGACLGANLMLLSSKQYPQKGKAISHNE
jgi:hypothetical protein